jgi:hypothetical protein
MARGDDDELFRPSNPLSVTEQAIEGAAQSNPLMMGRPGFYEQYSEPATVPAMEGISPEVAAANPLIRPPRPIKYMPVEQQIIWQERQASALSKQADLQNQLYNNKKAATEAKLDLARKAQSNAIFDAMGELDPTADDYFARRDKVLAANPIGAVTPEVKNLFGYKDEAWDLRQKLAEDDRKRKLDSQETLRKEAVSQARKDAVEIGDPALLEEVSKLSAQNPEAAVARVAQVKGRLAQSNITTQLQQYGVPPEEIKSLYYDPDTGYFRADAAAARVKMEESKRAAAEKPASEAQAADIFASLSKQKADLELYGKPVPPDIEKALTHYRDRLSLFATEPRTVTGPAPAEGMVPGTKAILSDGRTATLGPDGKWYLPKSK